MATHTRQTYKHRSVTAEAPGELELDELIETMFNIQPELSTMKAIQSIYSSGPKAFTITFHDGPDAEAKRQLFLEETQDAIVTEHGTVKFKMPTPPITRICIRAVPTEIEDKVVFDAVTSFQCGNILRIERTHHRNLKYKIENGFRVLYISKYVPFILPQHLNIMGTKCKIFLTEAEKCCSKCLLLGHTVKECTSDVVCNFCKKPGHRRRTCPVFAEQYPTASHTEVRNMRATKPTKRGSSTDDIIRAMKNVLAHDQHSALGAHESHDSVEPTTSIPVETRPESDASGTDADENRRRTTHRERKDKHDRLSPSYSEITKSKTVADIHPVPGNNARSPPVVHKSTTSMMLLPMSRLTEMDRPTLRFKPTILGSPKYKRKLSPEASQPTQQNMAKTVRKDSEIGLQLSESGEDSIEQQDDTNNTSIFSDTSETVENMMVQTI